MEGTIPLFGQEALEEAPARTKIAFAGGVEFRSVGDARDLFDGFVTMKAITWSYGLGMVVRQMRKFEHVELVFGCSAMLESDVKLSALAPIVQQAELVKELQGKYGREIADRVEDGSCELYFESTVSSHEKLYLLADERRGRYRVLTGSANLSERAWTGNRQKEVILCFEGREAYDAFRKNIYEPFKGTCTTHVGDLKAILERVDGKGFPTIDDVPMLRAPGGIVVIEERGDSDVRVSMGECALYGGLDKEGADALESALKPAGGRMLLDGSGIEALRIEGRRIEEAKARKAAACPELVVDGDGRASMNGKELSSEGFERDARTFAEFVDSFGIFTGDVKGWQANAWKIACWYFATPFFPRLRRACRRARQDGRISSLPMAMVLYGTSNAGKTALMRFLGKAMCGDDVQPLPGGEFKSGKAVGKVTAATVRKPRLMQVNQKGLPVLYDDVPGSELNDSSLRKLLIDSRDAAYDERHPNYPAIVATSNITPAMPREFRKRALFFESAASLPALDAIANGHVPSNLTAEVGPAMFSEYASRMAPLVARMCEAGNVESLDVYRASSSVLRDIMGEAGVHAAWAARLGNEDYFGEAVESRRAVGALVDYFRAHGDAFERNKRENRLYVRYPASDRNGERLLREVSNSLPPRCEPKMITGMLALDLRETEDICKRKFTEKRGLLGWLWE